MDMGEGIHLVSKERERVKYMAKIGVLPIFLVDACNTVNVIKYHFKLYLMPVSGKVGFY